MKSKAFLLFLFLFLAVPVWAQDTPTETDVGPDMIEGSSDPAAEPTDTAEPIVLPPVETSAPVSVPAGGDAMAGTETAVPVTPEQAGEALDSAISAAQGGQWSMAAGFGILVLIWIFRKINWLQWVPKKALPWVSIGLAMIGYIGTALASGGPLGQALWQGFTAGLIGVGIWEAAVKHVVPISKPPAV